MILLPYKPEIISSFNAWSKSEDKIPEHEYNAKYKSRSTTARRNWRKFSDLCKDNDLHPVKVATSLNGVMTIRL